MSDIIKGIVLYFGTGEFVRINSIFPYKQQARVSTKFSPVILIALHFSPLAKIQHFNPALFSCQHLNMQTIIHVVVEIWQRSVFVDLKKTLYGDTRTNIPMPPTETQIFLFLYCA